MHNQTLVMRMEKELEPVVDSLRKVAEDSSVPNNIKEDCKECIEILKNDEEELSVRVNSCTSILDEVSNDANIPMYTRTQVWNTVSMLESMSRE